MPDRKIQNHDLRKGLIAGVGSLVLVGGLYGADYASTRIIETIKANSLEPAGSFTPGTYSAEAMGIGTVKATLTFNETNLTDVELDTSAETPDIGGVATETLKEALMEAQSPDIDAVAGATVTSDAVMQAARSAFSQAAGIEPEEAPAEEATDKSLEAGTPEEAAEAGMPEEAAEAGAAEEATAEEGAEAQDGAAEAAEGTDTDTQGVPAGVYTPGTYSASAMGIGNVTVTMTFDENTITDVELDTSEETPEIGGAAAETLRDELLAAQSSEIDAIAGATVTTQAVQTAAADCIAQASAGTGGDAQETGDAAAVDISDVALDAVQKITEAADQSALTVSESTEDAVKKITEAADAAVQKIAEASDQASRKIAEAAGMPVEEPASVETGTETGTVSYEPGVYKAVAKGIGHVVVTLTVDDSGKIADVQLDTSEETDEIGGAAAETLISEALEAQNADIDIVSGATQTSEAVKSALRTILTTAGGSMSRISAENELQEEAAAGENTEENPVETADAPAEAGTEEDAAIMTAESAETAGSYTPGVYTAVAKGIGHVGVTLTVDESGKISDIQVDTSEETAEIGGAAAQTLVAEALEAQNAEIDIVSGATQTSEAVKSALHTVLTMAGGATEEETAGKTAYTPGTYTAYAKGLGGTVSAAVTVTEDTITDIDLNLETETLEIGQAAGETLKEAILAAQSADIDAVAGATITSDGVRYAVANALAQAADK